MTWPDSLRASCRGNGALAEAVIYAVQALLDRDAYFLSGRPRFAAYGLVSFLKDHYG